MYLTIEAIYENGRLRPVSPLAGMAEGQRLTVVLYDEAELRRREADFYELMKQEGKIAQFPEPSTEPPTVAVPFEPIKIQGEPLSQTILEERR
jgi:predicted DNA-binding antitoxin AbrB/MazE fold protein